MKTKLIYLIFVCMFCLSSCLKYGLDDIENSDLCTITSISFEHRWIAQNANGYDVLCHQALTLSTNKPDADGNIKLVLTVPAASGTAYNSFTASVRSTVTLDNLYLVSVISPAAKIEPVGNAPTLGLPAPFELNQEYKYKVTAANGNSAVYTIVIENFVK